jgi:monofunctional biosynthetic peptidoglycan transglycosylase
VPLAYLAVAILGRQRVLEIYLNIVEWGPGIFGAEAAAHAYFGENAAALTRRQAALMAVALPDPSVRNPGRPGPLTRKLARVVERRMPIIAPRAACVMPPRRLSGGGS